MTRRHWHPMFTVVPFATTAVWRQPELTASRLRAEQMCPQEALLCLMTTSGHTRTIRLLETKSCLQLSGLMEISREQAQTENGLMIFSENKPWVSLTTGPGSPIMEWDGGVGQDQPRKDRGGAWSSPGRVIISTTTAAY